MLHSQRQYGYLVYGMNLKINKKMGAKMYISHGSVYIFHILVAEFYTYLIPTIEEVLNPFCTELTCITNEMVLKKGNPTIKGALNNLHALL